MSDTSAADLHALYADIVQQLTTEIAEGAPQRLADLKEQFNAMSRPQRIRHLFKRLSLDPLSPPDVLLSPGGAFLGPSWPRKSLGRLEEMSPRTIAALIQLNQANLQVLNRSHSILKGGLVTLTGAVGLIVTLVQVGVGVPVVLRYGLLAVLTWFVFVALRAEISVFRRRRRLNSIGWLLAIVADLQKK
jgi:hypothetical protein